MTATLIGSGSRLSKARIRTRETHQAASDAAQREFAVVDQVLAERRLREEYDGPEPCRCRFHDLVVSVGE